MSDHIALYRAFRPMTFYDVIGQEHVTRTLQNEVMTGKAGHAFLFCGSRGTGKTSTARILARALNCENPKEGNPCNECAACRSILKGELMDIVEIDAASNNGVDNIRDLREEARFAASGARYKVYIIDEVHMLSTGAFNALLKLLEEPPPSVVFILATTETQKVPATILSRCQRFDFKRITAEDIEKRLLYVAGCEHIEIEPEACHVIARFADGALRDALSLLDQCAALGSPITEESVYQLLGQTDRNMLYRTVRALSTNDAAAAVALADECVSQGKSPAKFIEALIDYFSALLRYRTAGDVFSDYSAAELEEIRLASLEMSVERLLYSLKVLIKTAADLKYISGGRVMLDVALIRLATPSYTDGAEGLALRVAELERKVSDGLVPLAKAETKETTREKKRASAPLKKRALPAITGEGMRTIENHWNDICKDTKNIILLIALQHAHLGEENGKLLLVYDDKDSIHMTLLQEEATRSALSDLIEKHTGLRPSIEARLLSVYEGEGDGKEEADPLLDLEEAVESGQLGETEKAVAKDALTPENENALHREDIREEE